MLLQKETKRTKETLQSDISLASEKYQVHWFALESIMREIPSTSFSSVKLMTSPIGISSSFM